MKETSSPLADQVASLPSLPGVYLFKDRRDQVLYVGKAKDLRARVRQYFAGSDERFMVPYLVRAIARIDVVVVQTDNEALILENTLIKKHRPRYNTKLVDDSNFLHLYIDPSAQWPDYHLVRSIQRKKGRHFGPFASASRARTTLDFLNRRFPLRTCSDHELKSRTRPCLLHQMHRCLAPCVGLCSAEDYGQVVAESMLFLQGRSSELVSRLKDRMGVKAEAEQFEEAARLRDLIRSIEASIQQQNVVDSRLGDRDAWGLYREGDAGFLAVLQVRRGMMQEALLLPFDGVPGTDGDLLSSSLNTWYGEEGQIPPEVLLPLLPDDAPALATVLGERAGRAVQLKVPQRGEKLRLLQMASANAGNAWTQARSEEERAERALAALMAVCRLDRPPRRIECFDNSNIGGSDPVASMVVFTDGRPDRAEFRRYKVKTVVGSDDYATMREILGRRFKRALQDGVRPDLLVVDGGKGQLNAALAVLAELGITDQPAIGLVKPRTEHRKGDREATDRVVLPGIKDPVRLRHNDPALLLLQAVRDASHDTAIRFHRKRRNKRNLTSVLETLPGVGPARRKALLEHFGSAKAVAEASVEDIAALPGFGRELAQRIVEQLG